MLYSTCVCSVKHAYFDSALPEISEAWQLLDGDEPSVASEAGYRGRRQTASKRRENRQGAGPLIDIYAHAQLAERATLL